MITGTARCGEVLEDLLISGVQCKLSGVGHRRLHASPMSRRPSGPGQGEFLQDITPASVPNPRANPAAYVGGTLSRRGATLEERRSPGTPRGKSGNRDVDRPELPGISPRCTDLADPLVTSVMPNLRRPSLPVVEARPYTRPCGENPAMGGGDMVFGEQESTATR